jgi:hypothetical protein
VIGGRNDGDAAVCNQGVERSGIGAWIINVFDHFDTYDDRKGPIGDGQGIVRRASMDLKMGKEVPRNPDCIIRRIDPGNIISSLAQQVCQVSVAAAQIKYSLGVYGLENTQSLREQILVGTM